MIPLGIESPFRILDFVPSGCCVIGEGGEILFWNQTLEAWTRRSAADMVGSILFQVFPALGEPRFRDRILGVIQTGAPTVFSPALNPQFFPCTRSGGRMRIQQTTLNRLPSGDGRPLVLVTVSDVSDQFERGEKYRSARAQALEEARVRGESEERLRKVLENMPVIVYALDTDRRLSFWNREAERVTGYTAEEALDKREFFHTLFPDEHYRQSIMEVYDRGGSGFRNWECDFTCKDGSIRTIALSSIAKQLPIPGWTGGWGIGVDVTEREQKEQELRESEEQHRLVVGLTSSAILIGNKDGQILDCNTAACQIFQYSKDEIIQLNVTDFFPYKCAGSLQKILSEDLSTGDQALEMEAKRKNGASFPAEITAKFFKARGQRRFVAYIHDATDRKRAEEALRYAQKQESLGALAGGIAHDFNNLFGGVLGNLDLAQDRIPSDSGVPAYLDRIRGEILRAADLSRKMLAFSGKGRFAMGGLDLNRLLLELKPQLMADLSKKVTLRCRLMDGLPTVEGDPLQIQQVLHYLVTNASEAMGDREGTIDIVTDVQDLDAEIIRKAFPGQPLVPGPHMTLEVADTGCGISPENLPRIFDPFFTTKFAGRGLSLSVAQGILRAHRAGFAISSAVGVGTRFKLFFPAVSSVSGEAKPVQVSDVAHGRILLVDDETILRESVAEMLEYSGYEVATAKDGQEAVDYYREHGDEIALVLMDLTMPRMDGRSAYQAIRAMNPQAKVILSSGFSENDAIQQFRNEGLAGFLPKPYRRAQLEELVSKFVKPGKK